MSVLKILSAKQTRQLDQRTIAEEPITSLALMERASLAFFTAFRQLFGTTDRVVHILCGPGNNGGDGLAVARMLHEAAHEVKVWLADIGTPSPDREANLTRLRDKRVVAIETLQEGSTFPEIIKDDILIDALFGAGLSRPITDYWASLLEHLNEQPLTRVAIDIPSGLMADAPSSGAILKAHHTLTFQLPKLAFFAAENAAFVGRWQVLDIGLSRSAMDDLHSSFYYFPTAAGTPLLRDRGRFDHKGTYGHALIIAGSHGKIGAAILCARAALRAGCGLVSVQVPACGYTIMQIAFPEAMVIVDQHQEVFTAAPALQNFQAVGVGPGLGTNSLTQKGLYELLSEAAQPLILDADVLNILGRRKDWQKLLPKGSILTPHPKEFERLFGNSDNSFTRWELLREQARAQQCYVVLKGGNTAIATPEGDIYLLDVGNPGMGTAGAGDVLTGILCGLMAQGYTSATAAFLGVCLHGLSGDIAVENKAMESLIAEDIIEHLGQAFKRLRAGKNAYA